MKMVMQLRDDNLLKAIHQLYFKLLHKYGEQRWWSATTKFEIIVGAILVQNTKWSNVDKSLRQLKKNALLSPDALRKVKLSKLIKIIKPSGLYNTKAKYLKAFSGWYISQGSYRKLKHLPTDILRKELLSIHGIGQETADVILLHVFKRPVFIIDNYTQKLLIKLGLIKDKWKYKDLQNLFHSALDADITIFSEYHALIVHHGKRKGEL